MCVKAVYLLMVNLESYGSMLQNASIAFCGFLHCFQKIWKPLPYINFFSIVDQTTDILWEKKCF